MVACWLCAGIALAGGDAPEVRAEAPWKGSKVGRTDAVLPPWTPLELAWDISQSESSVEVRPWGRIYGFRGPFPERIVSREEDLLAGPIEIAVRGGRDASVRPTIEISEASGAKVVLESRGRAGPLSYEARTGIEYDGLIRVDLTFREEELDPVEEIALVIPLRTAVAKYLYRYPGRWGSAENAGALPAAGWSSPFRPFIWIGDEGRGLAWFCESDRNWSPPDPKAAIRIAREGSSTVLRLLLHSGSKRLEAPLPYTFGLQATPVKPIAEDAWDFRISHAGRYGLEVPDASGTSELDRIAALGARTICFHEHWTDIQNHWKPADPDGLRKLVAACHEKRIRLLLYFGYEMSTIAPEWEAFHAECLVEPRAGGYTRTPDQKAFIVCYRSHWQDFIAEGIARAMDEYGIDGVYLDGTANPWACANPRHGCGYVRPDGSRAPTYAIFPAREMLRRIHAIVKARKPDGLVNLHQSTCMTIPSVGWATSTWDGEQFGSIEPGAQDPMALLPLDAFRAEFMGHNWGVPAEFLCYGKPYTYRQALSFTLPHDVPVRPLRIHPDMELASSLWGLFDRFGRKGARWVPYWRAERELGLRADPGTASAYVRQGEGALIVVSNLTSGGRRIALSIDPDRLGLAGGEIAAEDPLAGKPIPIEGGAMTLDIDRLDWRIVRIAASPKRRPPRFVPHRIGTARYEPCEVGDFDGDGRLDIVSGPIIYFAPDWKAVAVRSVDGFVDEKGDGYYHDFMCAPLDVDGDGRLDIVSCDWFCKCIEWHRNDGGAGPWERFLVETSGNHECGDLVDIDGDGRALEILVHVEPTVWWEVGERPDGTRGLVKRVISEKPSEFGAGVGDVNGDGRPDVLRPTAWYEAPADPRRGQWKEHPLAVGHIEEGKADHTPQILLADVNADGRNDIVTSSAHGWGIFWYEQLPGEGSPRWRQHVIDRTWTQAHALRLADLDGDGDLDLVAGKRFRAHNGGDPGASDPLILCWYELRPGPTPIWIRHDISRGEGIGAGLSIPVVDLDGDGDLDIVVSGKFGGPVWFENVSGGDPTR